MKVLLFLSVLSFALRCHAVPLLEEWNNFKVQYNKHYADSDEENRRMQIFFDNKAAIDKHNAKYRRGLVPFEMGMNHYGDKTQREFELQLLGIEEEDAIRIELMSMRGDEVITSEGSLSHRISSYKVVEFEPEEISSPAGIPEGSQSDSPDSLDESPENSVVDSFVNLMKMIFKFSINIVERFKDTNEIDGLVLKEKSVNWVERGAVTIPKDQGICGSCWAFSAVGALESHHFIKTGKLLELSVQNLVDCTTAPEYSNLGCSGGIMDVSFKYVFDNKGIAKEIDYPYEQKNSTCRYEDWMSSALCSGFTEFRGGDHLKAALRDKGPASVVLDARTIEFRFYKSGIYVSKKCVEWGRNHAVLAVGYGTVEDEGYWLIKNSWGHTWGDNGFAKISMRHSCGIDQYGIFPHV